MPDDPRLTPWPTVFGLIIGGTLWVLGLVYLTTPTLVASYLLAVAYGLWLSRSGRREQARTLLGMLAYPSFLLLKWVWTLASSAGSP